MRFEHDGTRAVTPNALERELKPSVGTKLEASLSQRRTRDVTTQPLKVLSVPPINPLLCVNVDAAHFSHRLVRFSRSLRVFCAILRQDEPERALFSQHLRATRRSRVASGETGLIRTQLGGLVILHGRVE